MMQKPWFKTFIWFITTSFFFFASAIIISYFSPEPSEQQIMKFMSGMMGAMHSSLMGLSMSLEHDTELKALINTAAAVTIPLVLLGFLFGLFMKLRRKKDVK